MPCKLFLPIQCGIYSVVLYLCMCSAVLYLGVLQSRAPFSLKLSHAAMVSPLSPALWPGREEEQEVSREWPGSPREVSRECRFRVGRRGGSGGARSGGEGEGIHSHCLMLSVWHVSGIYVQSLELSGKCRGVRL